MEAFECDVAGAIAVVPFPFTDKRYTLCDVANDGRLDFEGLLRKLTSVSVYVRTEKQPPFRRRRALRPTVATEFGRELD